MTIVELSISNEAKGFVNADVPFVWKNQPLYRQYDSYWTDTFGAPDDSNNNRIVVSSFSRGGIVLYDNMASYNDMLAQEKSFWWDNANQILYVHFEHDQAPGTDSYVYGAVRGFSDTTVEYNNDVEYRPLVISTPGINKKADFQNYDGLSLANGDLVLSNFNGELDGLIESPVYGNNVDIFFGDDFTDLIQIGSYTVDDYDPSLTEWVFRLLDKRSSEFVDVPQETFSVDDYPKLEDTYEGKYIPIVYGSPRYTGATPIDGLETSGTTRRYRAALLLTALSTVEVLIDDAWVSRTPSNIDLSVGEFDVPTAVTSQGAPYKCRVKCTGIENDYCPDIILDLNNRFLNLEFIDSNYDTTEWNSEKLLLPPVAYVIDKKKKLADVISDLQKASEKGFQYDIKGNGQRTIRVDNPNREVSRYITNVKIQNKDEFPVTTDSSFLYSSVKVKYDKNFQAGTSLSVLNNSSKDTVISTYKKRAVFEPQTFLLNKSEAENRAAIDNENFSVIRPIAQIDAIGKEFFDIRLYDVIEAEITPAFVDRDNDAIEGREFYGVMRGQVIGIQPNTATSIMKISLRERPESSLFP